MKIIYISQEIEAGPCPCSSCEDEFNGINFVTIGNKNFKFVVEFCDKCLKKVKKELK